MTEGKAMKTYHFQGEEMVPSPALIYYRDGIEKNIILIRWRVSFSD